MVLEGYQKLPESESFGVLFGRLVRAKRGIEELSQDGLAGLSGLTKARISDLENGKTNNPQARTIDALCVALNISREERAACHAQPGAARLPHRLLENLALRFGHDNPHALEEELEAFLKEKAEEFRQMQARLAQITTTEGRIAELLAAASDALEEGDFQLADKHLAAAEDVQLTSTTLAALDRQSELRFARGHAALLAGEVASAVVHWETAAKYFSFLDRQAEAEKRYAYCTDLRAFGYRYRSVPALMAAREALQHNLLIWTKADNLTNWCRAMNALGGACSRLAQFDASEKFNIHIAEARAAYEAVRDACSETILPYYFAISGGNLASIYAERILSSSDAEYIKNLEIGLQLQISAIGALSKEDRPVDWGIFQHNIGNSYTTLFKLQPDGASSAKFIDAAIDHLERSFEVRDPIEMLQYWIASSRSLGEALIEKSMRQSGDEGLRDLQRAHDILSGALSRITQQEHPHQWAELQDQLIRCQSGAG